MSGKYRHLTYDEYNDLDYTQKPCSGACCTNNRVCTFCLAYSQDKLLADRNVYWVLNNRINAKSFAVVFCNETCFNCWILKHG
mgnify:FL=1